jgi:alanine racemase
LSSVISPASLHTRPCWAEVSLGTLQENFRIVQRHVGSAVNVCAVVKCDAYGHGVVECSKALQDAGAAWFGVTSVEEGMKLRTEGIRGRILVMTGFWRGEEQDLIRNELTATVWTAEHVQQLADAARKMKRRRVPVHWKIDTGMARLGTGPEDMTRVADALQSAGAAEDGGALMLEGFFSHLASSEVLDAADGREQIERFRKAVEFIRERGLRPKYLHLANSAAVVGRPDTWNQIVRAGLVLYGYSLPFISRTPGVEKPPVLPVKPVLSWKARIINLRNVGAQQPLGYSGAYVTPEPARIAVIPVGYGDGLSRHLSSRGQVIVRGEMAPMVGNVAMDLTLVDVTHVPGVEIGDEVLLIGEANGKRVSAVEQARWSQTIPYEVLCGLSPRVPRVYVD